MARLIILFLFLPIFLQAQEVCDNGVDDDGDELIDLNDDECECNEDISLIFEDFETFSCCPTDHTAGGGQGIECLQGFSNASSATPDYFNTCGYIGGTFDIPLLPMPLPSGNGAAGFISSTSWHEVVGRCLPTALTAGETYSFSFFLGFNDHGVRPSVSPITMAIYGTGSCGNYPASASGCILGDANWFLLGTVEVSGTFGNWTFASGSFVAPQNVAAIAVGADCDWMAAGSVHCYHFIDDFSLSGESETPPLEIDDPTIAESGDCISGYMLTNAGLAGATYQWYLDGIAVSGATNLNYDVPAGAEGLYTLMIMKDGKCATTEPYLLNIDFDVLDVSGEIFHVSCFGEMDGSIIVNEPSANNPFIYDWDNGQSSQIIFDLGAGSYLLTVTDANLCFGSAEFIITQPDLPLEILPNTIVQPTEQNPLGSISIDVVGGTPSYQIFWNNGSTDPFLIDVPPGSYSVTAIDVNGCEFTTEFILYTPLTANFVNTDEICAPCNGTITLSPIGGHAPYTYLWSNGMTSDILTNLCDGLYSYVITDQEGTTFEGVVPIGNYDPMTLLLDSANLVTCSGNDAYISMDVNGGDPLYTYTWNNGDTTATITNLGQGEYIVTVTDESLCEIKDTFYILQSPPMLLDTTANQPDCSGNNGSITIEVAGGLGPFTYLWSNGETSSTITNLSAGVYSVTITDSYGCMDSVSYVLNTSSTFSLASTITAATCPTSINGSIVLSNPQFSNLSFQWDNGATGNVLNNVAPGLYTVSISEAGVCDHILQYTIPSGPPIQLSATIEEVKCHGESTASIEVIAQHGLGTYEYAWSNNASTSQVNGLNAGTYAVTVSDAANCIAIDTMIINQPLPILITSMIENQSCTENMDGSISIDISGGVGVYEILWSNGADESNIDELMASTYIVTIKDSNACIIKDTFEVDIEPSISTSATITHAGCDDAAIGSIQIHASGGNGTLSYAWSNNAITAHIDSLNSGQYAVTITDEKMCRDTFSYIISSSGGLTLIYEHENISCFGANDGSIHIDTTSMNHPITIVLNGTVTTSPEINNLGFGSYTITLMDANGCKIEGEVILSQPTKLIATLIDKKDIDQNNAKGSATIAVSGGTAAYDIEWSNGEKGIQALNLNEGLHRVIITDGNGCKDTLLLEILNTSWSIATASIDNKCFGDCSGEITIQVNNAPNAIQFIWQDGVTTQNRNLLCNGTYVLDIYVDGMLQQQDTFIISSPERLENEIDKKEITCPDAHDGAVKFNTKGGKEPYLYRLGNGASTSESEFINLGQGNYTLIILDVNGCESKAEIEFINPPSPKLSYEVSNAFCDIEGGISIHLEFHESLLLHIDNQSHTINPGNNSLDLNAGLYTMSYTYGNNCKDTLPLAMIEEIAFIDKKIDDAHFEVQVGDTIVIDLSSMNVEGEYKIEWQLNNAWTCIKKDDQDNCIITSVVCQKDETYYVDIYNSDGCIENIEGTIRIKEEDQIILLPNVFDASIETFKPYSTKPFYINKMKIYDRWGNLVFLTSGVPSNEFIGWDGSFDGSKSIIGVYVYTLEITNDNREVIQLLGDVTLVR